MLRLKFGATKLQEIDMLELLSAPLLINVVVTQLWGEGRLVTDGNNCAACVCGDDTAVG
jgi:hypothetical protein